MRADLLHVVLVRSNFRRFTVPDQHCLDAIKHMLESGVRVTLVECAFGDRPFVFDKIEGINYVPVRNRTQVWNKENLMNIGVSRLPSDWQYVMFADADIQFRRTDWASEIVHGLQEFAFLQPWDTCYDLGPDGEHMQIHRSFGKLYFDGKPIHQGPNAMSGYEFAHPGYAWAMTRRAFIEVGGLIETAALGAADHHMALAAIGKAEMTIPGNISNAYKRPILQWEQRAVRAFNYRVGYIPGTIEHFFHGTKDNRKYVDRWNVLIKNGFDPLVDLMKNEFGVMELTGNKPNLTRDIERYFRQRNEDQNTL